MTKTSQFSLIDKTSFLTFSLKLEGLRRQLQEAEDGLVKGRKELIEAHRGLQECAQERDKQRKEVLDLRRLFGDESREKEAIQASNQELRAFIKRAESDNNR